MIEVTRDMIQEEEREGDGYPLGSYLFVKMKSVII